MTALLEFHQACCVAALELLLRLVVAVEAHRRWAQQAVGQTRSGLRRLVRRLRRRSGLAAPARHGRAAWNRTPPHLEARLVRLHVDARALGVRQLSLLAQRVLDLRLSPSSVRRILIRRRALVFELAFGRVRTPLRVTVVGPRKLWGLDLTLLWLLGVVPIWVLGIVDYHGSRLVALEAVSAPTVAEVLRVVECAVAVHGAPERLLTDNGPQFRADLFRARLAELSVRHVRTQPAHPWTNGRIERLFRTFKETLGLHVSVLWSRRHLASVCSDFRQFYNRDRPHSANGGLTPDEVHLGAIAPTRQLGRTSYFGGALRWWRFG